MVSLRFDSPGPGGPHFQHINGVRVCIFQPMSIQFILGQAGSAATTLSVTYKEKQSENHMKLLENYVTLLLAQFSLQKSRNQNDFPNEFRALFWGRR